ncbi:uncharacterized protein RSE6_10902 [Rhynchosporium secalis]|uniref:Uncharacterized protein n=1 Tax=Rhynchosporium secalis TaxID=38038 RepID=A0A1E1MLP1_RHYSE|nr:uncharacterized protein RSE6_10902 [Rhynchosporium secalis]
MSFEALGSGVTQGKVKLNGEDFNIRWQCYVPTSRNNQGAWVENIQYKDMVEKITCQAAGRAPAGRNYNYITIRTVSHETTRVGGSRSSVFMTDDPHLTIDFGPGPIRAATHVYVGPAPPHKITKSSDYAQCRYLAPGRKAYHYLVGQEIVNSTRNLSLEDVR